MKRRSKARILSFVLAGAAALGLSHAADRSALDGYRLAARYSAGHAFEETVSSVDALAEELEVKNAKVMWPVRIAAAGKAVTPGGAVEICAILGRDETLKRLKKGLEKLAE